MNFLTNQLIEDLFLPNILAPRVLEKNILSNET